MCFSATLFAIVFVRGNVHLSPFRLLIVFRHVLFARVFVWPSSRCVGDLLMFCVAFICRETRQMVPDAVHASVRKKSKKANEKSGRVW